MLNDLFYVKTDKNSMSFCYVHLFSSPASEGSDHQPGRRSPTHPRGAPLQKESDAQVGEATPSQGRPRTSRSCFNNCQVSKIETKKQTNYC